MNELMNSLDETQKLQLGEEIKKLFALQDRILSKEKLSILIDELAISGLPAGAILAGVRELMTADLKEIKYSTLLNASREKVSYKDEASAPCDECGRAGIVLMERDDKYTFSFRCKCANAYKRSGLGIAKWTGQKTIMRNGQTYSHA